MTSLTSRILSLALVLMLASLALGPAIGMKEAQALSIPPLFNAQSIWNKKIPAGASGSSAALGGLPVYLIGPDADGSTPVYVATSSTPRVTITDSGGNTMQVPVDPSWKPDPGSDGKITIVSGIQAYSIYRFTGTSAGSMGWGDLSATGDGIHVFRGSGSGWGGRAAGMTYIAGLITHDELASGVIPHALAISLPVYEVSGSYVWPAVASDGSGGSIQMGARLQLDPSVPLPGDPAAKAIYQALKDYGAWVVDTNSASIQFYAEARITSSGGVDSSYYSGLAHGNTVSSLPAGSLRQVGVTQSDFYVNPNQPCLTCAPAPTPTPTTSPSPSPTPAPAPLPSGSNLLSNPGFETGISPWATWQGGITQSADAHSGSGSANVTYVGGSTLNMYSIGNGPPGNVTNPQVGDTYSAAAWVKGLGSAVGKSVKLVIRETNSTTEFETSGAAVALTNAWQQLSAIHTIANSGMTGLDVYVLQSTAAAGDSFVADDFYMSRGAGSIPTPTPTAAPIPSPTPTPSLTPVPSPSPTPTPVPTVAPSPSQNPLPNPGFETGTAPWGAWQGSVATSANAHSGSYAAAVSYVGGGTLNMYTIGEGSPAAIQNPQPGQSYGATVWVKGQGSSVAKNVRLVMRERNLTTELETSGPWVALTSGWQQLSASHTIVNANMADMDIYVVQNNAAAGDSFLADDFFLANASSQVPVQTPTPSPSPTPPATATATATPTATPTASPSPTPTATPTPTSAPSPSPTASPTPTPTPTASPSPYPGKGKRNGKA